MIMQGQDIGHYPGCMGIFGLSVHEKITDSILASTVTPGMDRGDWLRWSKKILPVYHSAILQEGLSPFEVDNPETFPVYLAVSDKTGLQAGYVYLYLEALEALARAGDVPTKQWKPEKAEPWPPIAKIFTPEPVPEAAPKTSYFWPLMLLGVGGFLVLMRAKRIKATV
jgi:hypothetical protein